MNWERHTALPIINPYLMNLMKELICLRRLLLWFVMLSCLCWSEVNARLPAQPALVRGPANTEPIEAQQPDGTTVTVRLFGDEYYHFAETMDGYTVVRTTSGDAWAYATKKAPKHLSLIHISEPTRPY